MAKSVRKFREQIVALEAQREDIDHAVSELKEAVAVFENRLAQVRPDLLPQAADYDSILRARLDGLHETAK
jgi:predicted component of type VI protein secretion system